MKWLEKSRGKASVKSLRDAWVLVLIILLPGLRADEFTVDWHRIGQGGGTSANEEFTVSGVIGEPVSGEPAAADEFIVTGGFGVVTVLPTQGAPALAITPAGDSTVRIAWPLPDAGWELRQSSAPDGLDWEKPLEPLQDDGVFRFIGVTPAAGTRFYRLFAVDPSVPDQDGDGIPDEREAEFGFDPRLADTDSDGVTDGLEDAEGDGLPNAWELRHGFNPFARDSDANGVEDGVEDSDDDRLTNLREVAAGTHPKIRDSDGDSFNDEAEVTAGSAPLEARSRPQPFAVSGAVAELLRPAVQIFSAAIVGGDVTAEVLRPALPGAGQAGPTVLGTPQVSVEPQ